ncbi:MAG: alanine racemase [Deltaproteobacteria bacterium]|nr:alanine racemase [Deltaproteobacteria bacterium]
MARPTVAEIHLSALRHNVATIRSLLPPSVSIFAVVKADAYGHGAVPVAGTLREEGVANFGVATVEEGVELRRAGITEPVVVLGGVYEQDAAEAHENGLSTALFDPGPIPYLSRVAARSGKPFPVHIKIDTGMGRLGILRQATKAVIEAIRSEKALRVEGVMTHLSSADGLTEADREYTRMQLSAFGEEVPLVRKAFGEAVRAHALNSAGILFYREHVFDMVRPGITLYGALPAEGVGADLGLRPVMRLVTKVASLKELPDGHPVSYGRHFHCAGKRQIAAVPLGYADGYRRTFSNAASMWVNGHRVPVVGRVCMDHTMLDVTGIPGVTIGSDVVVMGEGGPTPDELAAISETISYEILTQVGRRVPRRVIG